MKRPSRQTLSDLYFKGYTLQQIADKFSVNRSSVVYWMDRENIPRRQPGRKEIVGLTEEVLRELYVNRLMTGPEIAEKIGCDHVTIYKAIRKFRIAKVTKNQRAAGLLCGVGKCRRPVKFIWHPKFKCLYGSKCAYHRNLHYAKLNRDETRKKNNIPFEKWRYQHEVPESVKKSKSFQKFKEEQCRKQARKILAEARSFLKQHAASKSQTGASLTDKTS